MILLLISFVAGALTALAPCIISLLPVIIGGSLSGDRSNKRAIVVTASLGLSVILFTLLLKASTVFISVPPETWQIISGVIIIILGFAMVFPRLWDSIPFLNRINRDSNMLVGKGYQKQNFFGDVLVGAALGPVFASCSPTYFLILATVLPASFLLGVVYLLVYAAGLTLMLLLITLGGQKVLDRLGVASDSYGWFKRSIGALFIIVGLGIVFGIDKKLQVALSGGLFDTAKIERYLIESQADGGLMPKGGTLNTMPVPEGTSAASPETRAEVKSTRFPRAPEITKPSGFVNTNGEPITLAQYRNKKVVLVDIWTYSCINCIRTTPYLNAWYEKYKDQGLEIVGVHTPEFAFERVIDNVIKATNDMQIKYPVVLDNDYATWSAFKNQYWPRKYLIDIDGFIVYDHAGEGDYEETEAAIVKALKERAEILGVKAESGALVSGSVIADAPTRRPGSPEIYFGAWRNEYFGNGTPTKEGTDNYPLPKPMPLKKNTLYLYGTWDIEYEYAKNLTAGEITFKYDAKNVYMVARADTPVRVQVYIDGTLLKEITVQEDKLYDIVIGDSYGEHVLDLKILDPGLEAYTFTFG